MRTGAVRQAWPWLLLAHAGVVTSLTVLFAILLLGGDPDDGANIGAGIVALPLLPLGLPWSLPAVVDPYRLDGLAPALWHTVTIGPAWLNLLLHGALFVRARR